MDKPTLPSIRAEIGQHVVLAENGVAQVLFRGRVSIEEAQEIKLALFAVGERFGRIPVIVDLDTLVDFDSGARASFARPEKPYQFNKAVFYGGTFAIRTLIVTIIRAGKLIAPNAFDFQEKMFATEAEARRYLEQEREVET